MCILELNKEFWGLHRITACKNWLSRQKENRTSTLIYFYEF